MEGLGPRVLAASERLAGKRDLRERTRRLAAEGNLAALDPERLRFEALSEAFGLSPADYGRQFSTGREQFGITGIDPRRPKYPVSAERIPDGQEFKFTAEQVSLLLQHGMKDVTPKT